MTFFILWSEHGTLFTEIVKSSLTHWLTEKHTRWWWCFSHAAPGSRMEGSPVPSSYSWEPILANLSNSWECNTKEQNRCYRSMSVKMSWSWCPVSPPGLVLVGVYVPEGTLIPILVSKVIACSQPLRLWCVWLVQGQPSPRHFIPKGCRIWAEILPPHPWDLPGYWDPSHRKSIFFCS